MLPWTPTHLLRWTPRSGHERTWQVRVIRTEIASQPWWLAQTLDDHRGTRPPEWQYERAADRWTWRGLDGYEGGTGVTRCEALDLPRGTPHDAWLLRPELPA